MNILITGGTGLVGKSLVAKLQAKGHQVRILTRTISEKPNQFYWNLKEKYIDDQAFLNLDTIIHLAGASISERWTEAYKKELFTSRIDTANLLKEYCIKNNVQLQSFISASGVNYYGTFTDDTILEENSPVLKDDFLAQLCVAWEGAADDFKEISKRVVIVRTAVVLAKNGGAFPMLKKLVDYNIGSAVGTGDQWMNWIHLDDLVNMYIFAFENEAMVGNFNAVADDIPSNKTFMKKLAQISHKFFLPINVPAFVLKLVFSEMSEIILKGTRVSNKKIKSQVFDFKYDTIEKAFKNLV